MSSLTSPIPDVASNSSTSGGSELPFINFTLYCVSAGIILQVISSYFSTGHFLVGKCPVGHRPYSQSWQMLQKMVLHGGKQYFIEGIGQYSQSLFDNMWLEHMLRVEKTRFLSRRSHLYIYIYIYYIYIPSTCLMDHIDHTVSRTTLQYTSMRIATIHHLS